jgi:hypothetical protein
MKSFGQIALWLILSPTLSFGSICEVIFSRLHIKSKAHHLSPPHTDGAALRLSFVDTLGLQIGTTDSEILALIPSINDPSTVLQAIVDGFESQRDFPSLHQNSFDINRVYGASFYQIQQSLRRDRFPKSQRPILGNVNLSHLPDDEVVVLYHGTTAEGIESMRSRGVDLTAGRGEFGNGFYMTIHPVTAQNYAARWAGSTPSVARVFIRRSALEQIHNQGRNLLFDYISLLHESNAKRSQIGQTEITDIRDLPLFRNFVEANRRLRDKASASPSDALDLVEGPSTSQRTSSNHPLDQHQIRFANTPLNQSLFSSEDIYIEQVDFSDI